MNVIHFSPHFPENYCQFSVALKRLGVNVLGIGDLPYDLLSDELKWAMSEYYVVGSMEDYNQLLRAVAYLTFKHGKIDVLDSFNEYWLCTEARLRTDFNIDGIKNDGIEAIKRKSRMKQKFIDAGIEVPKGRIVNTYEEAAAFVREAGYPVIAKPDIGVGAMNTYKIHNDAELRAFAETKPRMDYIMEEFVKGDILTFDGLTNRQGDPVFFSSLSYMCGIMETVNEDNHVYYYTLREIPEDLKAAGLRTAKAFGISARFFHFEFFRRHSDGKIVALEVNIRPPGGYTTDMFNYSNDIDIYQEWANIIVHNQFKSKYERKYHCCYIGRKYRFNYLHTHQQILDRLKDKVVFHSTISGVFAPALGDYGYLVRSPSLGEIHEAINYIQGTK